MNRKWANLVCILAVLLLIELLWLCKSLDGRHIEFLPLGTTDITEETVETPGLTEETEVHTVPKDTIPAEDPVETKPPSVTSPVTEPPETEPPAASGSELDPTEATSPRDDKGMWETDEF